MIERRIAIALSLAAIAVAATASPAAARHRHHQGTRTAHISMHHRGYAATYGAAADTRDPLAGPYGPNSANPYPASEADNPYNPYAPPGAAIRAMSRANQAAPGVTNELAPDNIATATGGPSGGVPGLSGH